MKVAVVGGGGFRTPLVHGALAAVPGIDEVVLHDLSQRRLDLMTSVIEGMDREAGGVRLPVRTTTSLEGAVEGAAFVLVAIRVGGLASRVVDETVPLRHGVLGQETVGPGGICFALRTVPVMLSVAETVAARAPSAWLLSFTNPAGLVTEAVQDILGHRAVGICDSPSALCARVARALGAPSEMLRFGYAGLNHLGWLTSVTGPDGAELLPGLLADDARLGSVDEARLFGVQHLRERGAIPNEYLVYLREAETIAAGFARDGTRGEVLAGQQAAFYDGSWATPEATLAAWRAAKEARYSTYLAEGWAVSASGAPEAGLPDEGAGEAGYGGVASDFVRAVTGGGGPADRLILDVANRGAMGWLDDEAVVEVPCAVDADGPRADGPGELGEDERGLVLRMKEIEQLTIEAALDRSLAKVVDAIAAHPLVPSREAAGRIVEGYLEGHAWMREGFR